MLSTRAMPRPRRYNPSRATVQKAEKELKAQRALKEPKEEKPRLKELKTRRLRCRMLMR